MSRPFNVRAFCKSNTSINFVVMARSSANVTLTINGTSYTISMSVTGDDRGSVDTAGVTHAGYYGTQLVTGLTPFTEYSYTASQSGVSQSYSITTNPLHKGQDFAVGFTTCFAPNGNWSTNEGNAWAFFNWYRQYGELPYMSTFHIDDIYYADGTVGLTASVGDFDPNGKVYSTQPPTFRTKYDFALTYGIWFGIYGPIYGSADTGMTVPYYDAAYNPDFVELMDNSGIAVIIGDHEAGNNIWGTDLTIVPNQIHATAGAYDGNAYAVWSQLMQPLSGTSIAVAANSHALHWASDIGGLRFIAADPVTQTSPTQMLGTNQITDILNAANSITNGQQFFTILGRSLACKDNTTITYAPLGFAYKSENFVQAEYDALMRTQGATPKSLMDNTRTNGNLGAMAIMRGDNHQGFCTQFISPAGGGLATENFYEICLNTVNDSSSSGSQYFPNYINLEADNMRLVGGTASVSAIDRKPARMTATIVEVFGSKDTPEMIIRQWDITNLANDESGHGDMSAYFLPEFTYGTQVDHRGNTWTCCFEKRIVLYGGNDGYDIDETPYQIPQVSTVGDL